MNIKIIAVGSSKWERFIRKWGVSFLIGEDILFDTFGDPDVFLRNIKKYKISLNKIKHIIISHNHWDHISGLWNIINKCKDLTIYICSNLQQDTKERIKSFGARVVEVDKPTRITDTICTTSELKGEYEGKIIYEQSLVIKTMKGLTVITGCAHPGITTIIDNVRKHFYEQIYLIAGGFHLKDESQQGIQSIISAFKIYQVEKVMSMHCTGRLATKLFKKEYGNNFIKAVAGSFIEV
ncbi:MAG: MBL fold metallo-hydrolase [Candidatus Omnitrophica bacterium]|jgi:7,8-dihydropterin-6-yl-methyl-4-(beta-D-ribofuranosyl)aminobenzene 5'-phosphate synthase|nr:MBL fold metallo-hydrolase [Candidatus Omnitrophota bacterium]